MRVFLFLLSLSGCSYKLIELASEYQTNAVYLDGLQKQLRIIHSNCDFENDCFRDRAEPWIEDQICLEDQFKNYGFVSQKECERAGSQFIDLISGVQQEPHTENSTTERLTEAIERAAEATERQVAQREAEQKVAKQRAAKQRADCMSRLGKARDSCHDRLPKCKFEINNNPDECSRWSSDACRRCNRQYISCYETADTDYENCLNKIDNG